MRLLENKTDEEEYSKFYYIFIISEIYANIRNYNEETIMLSVLHIDYVFTPTKKYAILIKQ